MTLTFSLYRGLANQQGEKPIYLYYREQGKEYAIPTGATINPLHWDAENTKEQWIKMSYGDGHISRNKFLREFKRKYQKIADEFAEKNDFRFPSAAEMKGLCSEGKTDYSLLGIFDKWVKFQSTERGINNVSEGTGVNYGKVKKRFEEYAEHIKKPASFDLFNMQFYDSFVAYCTSLGNQESTIGSYVKIIKTFLKWAKKKKYCKIDDEVMDSLKHKDVEKFFIFLTLDEFKAWVSLDLKLTPHLERARDNAIVQCCLGCRFGDLIEFIKRVQVVKGKYILRAQTQKNEAEILEFEVFPAAVAILKKYEGIPPENWVYSGDTGNILYNATIKEVGKLAGMHKKEAITIGTGNFRKAEFKYRWQLVTTHTFRRTFINLCLDAGVSEKTICSITGQSLRTLQRYKQPDRSQLLRASFLWDAPAPANPEPKERERE